MTASATITVNADAFARRIGGVDRAFGPSLHPEIAAGLLDAAAIYMGYARQQFRANSRGGGDWAPLAPSTVKKRGASLPILIEFGDLFRSLEPGQYGATLDGLDVQIQVKDPVAAFHQYGTRRMPQRRVLPELSDDIRAEIARRLADAVARAVQAITDGGNKAA